MKDFFKSRFAFSRLKLQDYIIISAFIAVEIILDRFLSINQWNIKIGFGFLPTALIAYRYGCAGSIATAAMADFIGAILFPIGPYYFPFTAVAALNGLMMGMFLYKTRRLVNILSAVIISGLVCTLILNTLCIVSLSKANFVAVLISRLPQFVFTVVAELVIFRYLYLFDLAFKKRSVNNS